MDREQIKEQYDRLKQPYDRLRIEVETMLKGALETEGIAYHLVAGRIKDLDSLLEKVTQNAIEEPFEVIHDICGVRVIVLFNSDLETCERIVEEIFEISGIDKKLANLPPSQFDYASNHYVAKLPSSVSGHYYEGIKGLEFEIQLRTIATHAWAEISHYLDYKSDNAIPARLKKDFYALNALFYLADNIFETIVQEQKQARNLALQQFHGADVVKDEKLDLDVLSAYLRLKFEDREQSGTTTESILLTELLEAGYSTTSQLDSDLKKSEAAFLQYEKDYLPATGNYARVGVVRVSLSICNENFLLVRGLPEDSVVKYRSYQQYLEPKVTAEK